LQRLFVPKSAQIKTSTHFAHARAQLELCWKCWSAFLKEDWILLKFVHLQLINNQACCEFAYWCNLLLIPVLFVFRFNQVGDSALYLGLLGLFAYELKGNFAFLLNFYIENNLLDNQLSRFSDMQFSFFLFSGYVGVSLLSPVMHNLWIWRVWSFGLSTFANRLIILLSSFS
jgi:hypothetical protein